MPWMNSKYHSRCTECHEVIDEGDRMLYDFKERKAYCADCGKEVEDDPADVTAVDTAVQARARKSLERK